MSLSHWMKKLKLRERNRKQLLLEDSGRWFLYTISYAMEIMSVSSIEIALSFRCAMLNGEPHPVGGTRPGTLAWRARRPWQRRLEGVGPAGDAHLETAQGRVVAVAEVGRRWWGRSSAATDSGAGCRTQPCKARGRASDTHVVF
jgi:hypothetical protein